MNKIWNIKMKLSQYFEDNMINKKAFQKKIGMSSTILYRILNGKPITLATANKIVEATDGQVTYEDLVASQKRPLE